MSVYGFWCVCVYVEHLCVCDFTLEKVLNWVCGGIGLYERSGSEKRK